MRFINIAATTLFAALQVGSVVAKEPWTVNIFTDDLCEDKTGSWTDTSPDKFESLDGYPDIMSMSVEGKTLENTCGWAVVAYDSLDGSGNSWQLEPWHCFRVGSNDQLKGPIKGFQVAQLPC